MVCGGWRVCVRSGVSKERSQRRLDRRLEGLCKNAAGAAAQAGPVCALFPPGRPAYAQPLYP